MSKQLHKKIEKINGYQIAYLKEGQGEHVILLHGITSYSFLWRNIIPVLTKKYTVIAPDLIGCGDSDKILDISYSLKNQTRIINQLVQQLNIEKFHIVGHDLGGGISQIYSVTYPERLLSMTLINSVAYNYWPVQPIITMRTPIIRQLAMASLDIGTYKLIIKRALYNKNKLTADLMEKFWHPLKTKDGRKAFLHFARSLDNQELLEISESLKQLDLPVFIIRGENDVYLNRQISEELHKNIPGSKLTSVPRAGHFIQEDEPELVANLLLKFFDESK